MNVREYRKACSYAYKLTNTNYKDIVHDAYIDYYLRTGKDLFDAPNHTIIVTVRNHYYNSIRRGRFMYKGVYYRKVFYSLSNNISLQEGVTEQEYLESRFNLHSEEVIVEELIVKDKLEQLTKVLTSRQNGMLNHSLDGNTFTEIAETENVNRSSVVKNFKWIRRKANILKIRG